jgi:CheY-like chemotaxis protein
VMLDHDMPELSGGEALIELRAAGARVPVILTSGYTGAGQAPGWELADRFLPKPFSLAQLAGALRAAGR